MHTSLIAIKNLNNFINLCEFFQRKNHYCALNSYVLQTMQVIELLNFSSTNLITNQRTRLIIQISNLIANKGDFDVESVQKIQNIIPRGVTTNLFQARPNILPQFFDTVCIHQLQNEIELWMLLFTLENSRIWL